MTNVPPPRYYDGTPHRYLLGRGSCLWRVHDRKYCARSFKAVLADPGFGGARFDATEADKYPFYYAALDQETALAETLFRDLHPDDRGRRLLTGAALAGRQISGLTMTQDLELVSLITGEALGAIGQDAWLVNAAGSEYAQTRTWGHWIRGHAKWAHGFIWNSLRDPGRLAVVLFGDRLAAAFGRDYERRLLHEVPELAVLLDDAAGGEWMNGMLARYRVAIEPPPPDRDR
ncbi:MAG: RES family NAD+ phosphorylase [Streptosporangiaceae bacterium]